MTLANRPGSDDVYLNITAYNVTSVITTDGDCITISGTSVTLPTPFNILTASEPFVTDSERLLWILSTDFVASLNYAPMCSLSEQTCFDNRCLFDNEVEEEEEVEGRQESVPGSSGQVCLRCSRVGKREASTVLPCERHRSDALNYSINTRISEVDRRFLSFCSLFLSLSIHLDRKSSCPHRGAAIFPILQFTAFEKSRLHLCDHQRQCGTTIFKPRLGPRSGNRCCYSSKVTQRLEIHL